MYMYLFKCYIRVATHQGKVRETFFEVRELPGNFGKCQSFSILSHVREMSGNFIMVSNSFIFGHAYSTWGEGDVLPVDLNPASG